MADTVNATYKVEIGWYDEGLIIGEGVIGDVLLGLGGTFAGDYDDVSADLEEAVIDRGRDDPVSEVQAGTCDIVLCELTGKYNPENASSPLYGFMLPNREVRVTATYDAVTYGLFRGVIRSLEYDPITRRTQIHAEDLFLTASRLRPTVGPSAGMTGELINEVLDELGIPESLRDVDDADGDYVTEFSLEGTPDARSGLQGIADLLESERGLFFADRDGKLSYRERHWQPLLDTSATLDNVFSTYLPGLSLENVRNVARITKTDSETQEATNGISLALYGPSDITIDSPYFEDDAQALALAEYLVWFLGDPRNPVWELPFLANHDDATMEAALSTDLFQRVTVAVTSTPEQPGLEGDYFVESIHHEIRRGDPHRVSWKLSRRVMPGDGDELFVLDESTLGGGDILAYY